MDKQQTPVVLMILDGWGISKQAEGNAIVQGNTPNMERLFNSCGHSQLLCSGEFVGLPEGQQGYSEVGAFEFMCRKNRVSGTDHN